LGGLTSAQGRGRSGRRLSTESPPARAFRYSFLDSNQPVSLPGYRHLLESVPLFRHAWLRSFNRFAKRPQDAEIPLPSFFFTGIDKNVTGIGKTADESRFWIADLRLLGWQAE
jgi:hypothetical protein